MTLEKSLVLFVAMLACYVVGVLVGVFVLGLR